MAEAEWGAKRECPTCRARFYDLQKDPATCPECGASFALASLTERKSAAPARARAKPEKAAAAKPAADDLIDDEEDAEVEGDDVLLDDEEDDDEDLGEIDVKPGSDEEET